MKKCFYLQLQSVVSLSPSLEKGDVAVWVASSEMLNYYKGDLQYAVSIQTSSVAHAGRSVPGGSWVIFGARRCV